MLNNSQNIIIDASKIEWPPVFLKCELCDFQTMEISEIKKHIKTPQHQKKEADEKRETLGWFFYFGKLEEHFE